MAGCGCARWCCLTSSSITIRRTRCTPAPASTPRASSPRCSKRSARTSRPKRSSWPDFFTSPALAGEGARRAPRSQLDLICYDRDPMKIYLAGPDVFLHDAVDIGRRKVELCARRGLTGLSPRDNPADLAARQASLAIFRGNEAMMIEADAVIANLTPFRGPGADA